MVCRLYLVLVTIAFAQVCASFDLGNFLKERIYGTTSKYEESTTESELWYTTTRPRYTTTTPRYTTTTPRYTTTYEYTSQQPSYSTQPNIDDTGKIDEEYLKAIHDYMMSVPEANAEDVDALIKTFEKLNRAASLQNFMYRIPGAKYEAVKEFMKIYIKATTVDVAAKLPMHENLEGSGDL